jgi:hypothetical protein
MLDSRLSLRLPADTAKDETDPLFEDGPEAGGGDLGDRLLGRAGICSSRFDILSYIHVAVVLSFCISCTVGSDGMASTVLIRKRMSSKIEAVAAFMFSESAHSPNDANPDTNGELCDILKGTIIGSLN